MTTPSDVPVHNVRTEGGNTMINIDLNDLKRNFEATPGHEQAPDKISGYSGEQFKSFQLRREQVRLKATGGVGTID